MYISMHKTTIVLREDVRDVVEKEFGKHKLSEVINELLFKELIEKKQKEMFGCWNNSSLCADVCSSDCKQ